MSPEVLRLFEGYGVEVEYMIVDAGTLSVRPSADELLRREGGGYDMDVELGSMAWSNELALHVIELKTNGPVASLAGLGATFQEQVGRMQRHLKETGAHLLPTAMHPWMDPHADLRLWPHEYDAVYRAFDRIFDCRGHGWANLQSAHINLPFSGDAEFGRLHAAVRLVLPLVPGLAASSPYLDGKRSEYMDARIEVYRNNANRVSSVVGHVIPEPVFTRAEYEGSLLQRIYDDLAPLDPEGVLRHEWVNARGCIARFDRMALEIRLIDVQECPRADVAIAAAVIAATRALVEEAWSGTRQQRRWDERELAAILDETIRHADETVLSNRRFLDAFGYPERGRARLRELWQHLVESLLQKDPLYGEWEPALRTILGQGCLARRIVAEAGTAPPRERLFEVYHRLADCLDRGEMFRAGA
jgi:hypothetical protein